MKDARKGAKDIGRMLESKQLKANVSKSKFVVIGSERSKKACLKEAEQNPIRMGDHVLENSASEKYLGDKINENLREMGHTKLVKKVSWSRGV